MGVIVEERGSLYIVTEYMAKVSSWQPSVLAGFTGSFFKELNVAASAHEQLRATKRRSGLEG